MARLYPALLPTRAMTAGQYRERDVLERLELALPEGYEIFHNVDWHSLHEGKDRHGEIDVIVMNRSGALLLLEIKAGQVSFTESGVSKQYGAETKQVDAQLRRQYAAMLGRLKNAGIFTPVKNALLIPDCRVGSSEIVALSRERILDADDFERLGSRIQEILPVGAPGEVTDQVRRFLSNLLNVAPDVNAMRSQISTATRQLADGLATWAPRITSPSGAIRIQATAGSGKTQLALRLLEEAASRQERALYVCYNRALADRILSLAPHRAEVGTFHERCIEHYRRTVAEPDFSNHAIFDAAADHYLRALESMEARFDLLIIDEAQDFSPDWVAGLIHLLKEEGRLYLLEDEDQRLYPREEFDLPGAVTLRCQDNFRSPRAIARTINAFGLAHAAIRACAPHQGQEPEFRTCDGSIDAMQRETEKAIRDLIARGFAPADIAVLSYHGLNKSQILHREELAGIRTLRATGFTRDSTPIWSEGDLLTESVYRFKGQAAPAVILSEIDFAELTEHDCRKLFVGLTRAQIAVILILSENAAAQLAQRLD